MKGLKSMTYKEESNTREMMQEIQEIAEKLDREITLELMENILRKNHEHTKDMPCEGINSKTNI